MAPTQAEQDDATGKNPRGPRHARAVALWRRGLTAIGAHGLHVLAGTNIRIPQLAHSLNEAHAFRQTQTALAARTYAEGSINLLHSPLPIFGRAADVPLEFPIVQAIGAVLMRLGVPDDMAMRLVSLAGFQASAVLLFLLVSRWHGRRIALIALALFEFSPFGLAWGAASLIEFCAVAAALAMVVGLDRWFTDGSRLWLGIGAVGAWLAFLIKVTTAPVFCLLVAASGLAIVSQTGWRPALRRLVAGVAAGPAVGFVLGLAWTRHADAIKADSVLYGWLTSGKLEYWNFGTLYQRQDPANYAAISDRVIQEIVGPTGLVALAGLLFALLARTWPDRLRRMAWPVAALAGPFVFFNLYATHSYYLSAVFAAWVVVAAFGVEFAARAVTNGASVKPSLVAAVLVGVVLLRTAISPLGGADVRQWRFGQPPPAAAAAISAATRPSDGILILGCDWDPTIPYFSHRAAVMPKFVPDDVDAMWAEAGGIDQWNYVYLCDPDIDVAPYLPPGVTTAPTTTAGLLRLETARP
jgi:4-amino-4-deoxy-L-arabinose transferase-like glycosyltransferase